MAKRRLRRANNPSQSPSVSYPQSLRDGPEAAYRSELLSPVATPLICRFSESGYRKQRHTSANIKYCRSPISWMVRCQRRNLPRRRPMSWMVQCQTQEPSTIMPQITDGPISRPEPSTLEAGITDGPILQDRTFHAEDPYRGWFNAKQRNLPR